MDEQVAAMGKLVIKPRIKLKANPGTVQMIKSHGKRKTDRKYNNVKAVVDGIRFDSKAEAQRYKELTILQKVGEISELQTQVTFPLIPSKRKSDGKIERSVNYIADFAYKRDGVLIVEDTKSKATITPSYVIKRKLMLQVHGIEIQEIYVR